MALPVHLVCLSVFSNAVNYIAEYCFEGGLLSLFLFLSGESWKVQKVWYKQKTHNLNPHIEKPFISHSEKLWSRFKFSNWSSRVSFNYKERSALFLFCECLFHYTIVLLIYCSSLPMPACIFTYFGRWQKCNCITTFHKMNIQSIPKNEQNVLDAFQVL